ncbi:hypothetical protein ZWY2020_050348 [Hordeum vulgare]|nr:hypothetical protein ZWY2020_050348 [Hordeum vulgare]
MKICHFVLKIKLYEMLNCNSPCSPSYVVTPTSRCQVLGDLEKHCFWGNEVKLYEHHVDKLFAMFWHKKPKVEYHVCTINNTFAKPDQSMDKVYKYIHEDDDTLPLKLGDGTVSCDSRLMLRIEKRATIMIHGSYFLPHHPPSLDATSSVAPIVYIYDLSSSLANL